jgi:hypothetical protein
LIWVILSLISATAASRASAVAPLRVRVVPTMRARRPPQLSKSIQASSHPTWKKGDTEKKRFFCFSDKTGCWKLSPSSSTTSTMRARRPQLSKSMQASTHPTWKKGDTEKKRFFCFSDKTQPFKLDDIHAARRPPQLSKSIQDSSNLEKGRSGKKRFSQLKIPFTTCF